jgi:hypothetical protein
MSSTDQGGGEAADWHPGALRCYYSSLGETGEFAMLRYRLAVGLFAAGVLLSTAASAWAFSQQIVSPDGGNYSFGDADKQPTSSDDHSASQGAKPFGSNGPVVQFGIQQGPVSTFGQSNRYNTPDPYYGSLKNGN